MHLLPRLIRFAIEFALFFAVFAVAFVSYLMRTEPTKFIYYNF
jgi:hypothetical protein